MIFEIFAYEQKNIPVSLIVSELICTFAAAYSLYYFSVKLKKGIKWRKLVL